MPRDIFYGADARARLRAGVDKLANAVKSTLGPKGRNVIIYKGMFRPVVTKDGVTVAREVELRDRYEQAGALVVREAASKTNDDVGDGTTTSTLLAQEVIRLGFRAVEDSRTEVDVHAMRDGMTDVVDEVCRDIDRQKRAVSAEDLPLLTQVATISANNDAATGSLIAGLMSKVGKDGVITVEESQGTGIETEVVEGIQLDRGVVSPYMVTNQERMEAIHEDVKILITDRRLSSMHDVMPVLEKMSKAGIKKLVIVADSVDGDALATLVVNRLRGMFDSVAVRAPSFGEARKALLRDLAILTGGTFISEDIGRKLENVEVDDLGEASKVVITKDKATFIGGKCDRKEVDERIAEIRLALDKAESEHDREKLAGQIAMLQGKVALIKVGASTESEMKEKKYLIEDALNAVKAALDGGIVAGGGSALLLAKFNLSTVAWAGECSASRRAGRDIVAAALETPFMTILKNAGRVPEGFLSTLDIDFRSGRTAAGFDAKGDVLVEDMFDAGIVDPADVVKAALRNAVSAATLILTCDCFISEEPEAKKE